MPHHQKHILFVFTSAEKTLTGKSAGWYLPEVAHPYYVLKENFEIDFAAPKGANPPISLGSVEQFKDDPECHKFLNDPEVKEKLSKTKALSDIQSSKYDAVFYPGGHGPMFDLANDKINIKLANEFLHDNKLIAAVCHGPAALINVTDKHGTNIFKDKTVSAFTNEEEKLAGFENDVPFLLETKIRELGANVEQSVNPYEAIVRVDGHLITGQNPASARPLAEALLKLLK